MGVKFIGIDCCYHLPVGPKPIIIDKYYNYMKLKYNDI